MPLRLLLLTGLVAGPWAPADLFAQQFTVQQPSFQTFSVATTVSVPDRGSALLGGVGRAASGRINSGPLRTNTNTGRDVQGGSVTASVRIHDFAEMDRQVLSQAARSDRTARLPGQAEHAYNTLVGRHSQLQAAESVRLGSDGSDESATAQSADRYLRKGMTAKSEGKPEVARVWFRLAEKHGSTDATAELGKLNRSIARRN